MAPPKKTADPKPAPLPKTGQLLATEPLTVDGVPAFAVDDPVPADHVERYGWRDKVRHVPDEPAPKVAPRRELPAAGYLLATEPLFADGARAFNPGDQVPVDLVVKFDWHDKVRDPNG